MVGSLASATTMLLISINLEFFGPEAPISYGIILAIFGAMLILISLIIFQKIEILGTEEKGKQYHDKILMKIKKEREPIKFVMDIVGKARNYNVMINKFSKELLENIANKKKLKLGRLESTKRSF